MPPLKLLLQKKKVLHGNKYKSSRSQYFHKNRSNKFKHQEIQNSVIINLEEKDQVKTLC